eukprot:Gregarina_sp_Poly_1__945@NODE_1228_length_4718_cov_193_100624_g836_i0_p4_GENE_NODE_1228_length_4718_cov_193_100624_g836_i0NODE_1228_length_4718_cov_193_100624_g836_i0_p4_ORF_typecomplete_len175_score15_01_NODE_1228_length_4718_cov_193_100624_g836_i041054629
MEGQVVRSILSRGASQRSIRKQLSFPTLPPEHDIRSKPNKISRAETIPKGPMPVTGRGRFLARHRIKDPLDVPLIPCSLWASYASGLKEDVFRAVNIPDELKQLIPEAEWEAASERSSTVAIWDDYFSCCPNESPLSRYLGLPEEPMNGPNDIESRLLEEARQREAENFIYEPF